MKKSIIYIGNFSFPKENSAGIRVLNNGYLFRSLNYNVIFIGLSKKSVNTSNLVDTHQVHDDFHYYSFSYPTSIKDWIFFREKFQQSISIIEEENPSLVIAYGSISNSLFSFALTRWCKSKKIKIIHDCVDWLSGGSGSLAFRIGKHIDTEIQKRYINASGNGLITVSNFLKNYYANRGCKVLIIPPLSKSLQNNDIKNKNRDCIKIIYSGFPFVTTRKIKDKTKFKDRLDIAIELLASLERDDFIFDIYGITKENYLKVIPEHESLLQTASNKINFHGVVSNQEVVDALKNSDLFFLYRDKNRMTEAGFPSKVVESISYQVPVITTKTSDLSSYIKNGNNGFLLNSNNFEEVKLEFSTILDNIHSFDSSTMQNPFKIKEFEKETEKFLKEIIENDYA